MQRRENAIQFLMISACQRPIAIDFHQPSCCKETITGYIEMCSCSARAGAFVAVSDFCRCTDAREVLNTGGEVADYSTGGVGPAD